MGNLKIARIYMRVSTHSQDLSRQEKIIEDAQQAGYYIAGIYKDKASGVTLNRPELNRMINDLQKGDVIISENMDRIGRLPIELAEELIAKIKSKGARIVVPNIVDFGDIKDTGNPTQKIVVEALTDLILRLALETAKQEYDTRKRRTQEGIAKAQRNGHYKNVGRKKNLKLHKSIIELRAAGKTVSEVCEILHCSPRLVYNVSKAHKEKNKVDGQLSFLEKTEN